MLLRDAINAIGVAVRPIVQHLCQASIEIEGVIRPLPVDRLLQSITLTVITKSIAVISLADTLSKSDLQNN
jgi:hypothetical protein